MIKGPLRESAPANQPGTDPKIRSFRNHPLNNTSQRGNPISEITSLVIAEIVKEVLHSEGVQSTLEQKLRQNLKARLDAEMDVILDEPLGVPAVPEPKDITGDGDTSDSSESTPDSDMMIQACARGHRCVSVAFILL